MRTHAKNPAFTLMEIIIVMIIISISLALAAPSLRGWSQGRKLRDAAEQVQAAATYARSQAAATANPHRLMVHADNASYLVLMDDNGVAGAVPGEFGIPTTLPPGFSIALRSGGVAGSGIDFFPNGRVTPGVVRITAGNGQWIDLGCETAADRLRILVPN